MKQHEADCKCIACVRRRNHVPLPDTASENGVQKEYYDHLCACGCGGKIKVQPHHSTYGVPKFIHGHHVNIINPMKEETCKEKHRGLKRSPELKKRWGELRKGEKNPAWKGGTTELSAILAGSPEAQEWRTQALRESPCCEICGSKYRLQVHHMDSVSYLVEKYNITKENWRQYAGVLFNLDNAVVLCYDHHNKSNGTSFHAVFGRKGTTRDQFLLYFAECLHILERW